MSGLTVDFRINARDVEVALEVPEGGRLAVIGPNADVARLGGYYGEPRNVMVTTRWDF